MTEQKLIKGQELLKELKFVRNLAAEFDVKESMLSLTVYRSYQRNFEIDKGGLMGAMINAGEDYIKKELNRLEKEFKNLW